MSEPVFSFPGLKSFRGLQATPKSSLLIDWLLGRLAGTFRTFCPLCASRRLVLRGIKAPFLSNLRSDPESTGGLFIKVARDGQILSLLIRANTGSGPQTEHAINLPAVMSFITQSFLQFVDSGRCPTLGTSLLTLDSEASVVRGDPEIAVISNKEAIPAHAVLLANSILFLRCSTENRFAQFRWRYCAERLMS